MPTQRKRTNEGASHWPKPSPEVVTIARQIMDDGVVVPEAVLEHSPLEIAEALDQLIRLKQMVTHRQAIMEKLAEKVLEKADPNAARVWNEMVTGQKPITSVPRGSEAATFYDDALDKMRKAGVTGVDDLESESPDG